MQIFFVTRFFSSCLTTFAPADQRWQKELDINAVSRILLANFLHRCKLWSHPRFGAQQHRSISISTRLLRILFFFPVVTSTRARRKRRAKTNLEQIFLLRARPRLGARRARLLRLVRPLARRLGPLDGLRSHLPVLRSAQTQWQFDFCSCVRQ